MGGPPVISSLPDTTLLPTESLIIYLDEYVSDVSNTDDELTWTVDDDGGLEAAIDPISHLLSVDVPSGFTGDADIILMVSDPWGQTDADTLSVTVEETSVGDEGRLESVPRRLTLRQNYPNPFNAGTTIVFDLPGSGKVRIEIYNPAGWLVRSFSEEQYQAGTHQVSWDGRDEGGRPAPSGVYICRLTAGDVSALRKLVILR